MVPNRYASQSIRAETNMKKYSSSQNQNQPGSNNIRRIPAKTAASDSKKLNKSDLKADASWFYPVGSSVTHKTLGKGIVLSPKSISTSNDAMLVHIKFLNGKSQSRSCRNAIHPHSVQACFLLNSLWAATHSSSASTPLRTCRNL